MKKRLWVIICLALFMFLWPVARQSTAQAFKFELAAGEERSIDFLPISPFVSLLPDRGNYASYTVGDRITLQYESMIDGFVSIFNYTPDGLVRIIVNNKRVLAGEKNLFHGLASEPIGTERFLILLATWVIPDRILTEAMRYPSRIGEIIGERVYLNRGIIEVVPRWEKTRPILRFDLIPSEIPAGGQVRIRAFLMDKEGNVLVNRRIQWEADEGSLDHYQTFTTTEGGTETWFRAPRFLESVDVRVRAVFEGDMLYLGTDAVVSFTVSPERLQTQTTLTPESFHVASGEQVDFQVEVLDLRGIPVEGRTIRWLASRGHWENELTRTDPSGKTANRWYAPRVDTRETVELKALFEGVRNFLPSEDISYGTVSGIGVFTGLSTYYLDFGGGKPTTNFENLTYRGELIHGFSINPIYSLKMLPEQFTEVHFHLSSPLKAGALYLWGQSEDKSILEIFLNDQKVFSGPTGRGRLTPLESNSFFLTDFLRPGLNRLRIELKPFENQGNFFLQRLLVVF
ncbi:MAG TPA: hypothetical protein VLH40_01650 [Atribacteraceae bacterium]|nr:hypothetical protein [Atribacteraceae bacterium]